MFRTQHYLSRSGQCSYPSFAELGPRKTCVAIAIFVAYAIALYIWLAVNVKRCHNKGHSGWFVLLGLIPLVNIR
jgi:uncharacterized membrane protein YhaH (DUF805 family)